ncbi:hypothetical protein CDL15_Pgr021878 [Punica granatum]|uniref:Uncharacterized protein n=1 Tax=Punica granatum TaxID=22663 RepID=A0A218WSU4_PUNGR|nr:hypothetical protein CDL15_Pgr021878 [Punica granatum]
MRQSTENRWSSKSYGSSSWPRTVSGNAVRSVLRSSLYVMDHREIVVFHLINVKLCGRSFTYLDQMQMYPRLPKAPDPSCTPILQPQTGSAFLEGARFPCGNTWKGPIH